MKKILIELNVEELDQEIVDALNHFVEDVACINSWEEYEEPVF
jgi:hypothetical protein